MIKEAQEQGYKQSKKRNDQDMRIIKMLLSILLINAGMASWGQKSIHLFEPTESMPKIIAWNVNHDKMHGFYIEERKDSLNRVLEIKFCQDGEVYHIPPIYGASIIKYKYVCNRIYEYYYNKDGYLLSFNDNESPCCRIYYLNDKKEIIKCELIQYIGGGVVKEVDFNDLSFVEKKECNTDYIIFYLYSFFKMNGIYPKRKHFRFDKEVLRQVYSDTLIKLPQSPP